MALRAREDEVRRFTRDEVLRMVEAGILAEDEPVELLDGELVIMSPQGPPHRAVTIRLRTRFDRVYGERAHTQEHTSIDAGEYHLPEPDVAVARGRVEDFLERLPSGADLILVVEVAQTSRQRDQRKAALYAAAGVPVYWLVDLPRRTVSVYSEPAGGDGYRRMETLGENDVIALPESDAAWPIREFLP